MPKHRQTVFNVVRLCIDQSKYVPTVVGVYLSLERAEEIKGKFKQEMKEKKLEDIFDFTVQASTYYDE